MPGLASSRWAARSASHPGQPSSFLNGAAVAGSHPGNELRSPAEELSRYTKIVRRLKWKLPYLAAGYRQATASVVENGFAPHQAAGREARAEAGLMFKLDFFEYYMLLERALVHLLGVFGIAISRGGYTNGHALPQGAVNKELPASTASDGDWQAERASSLPPPLRPSLAAPWASNPLDHVEHVSPSSRQEVSPPTVISTYTNTFAHRYHANVLEALDNPSNPLHDVLGPGTPAGADVRRQLARAKDLRNRWKNADADADAGDAGTRVAAVAPLESYDLERILATVFAGFDGAFAVADRFVVEQRERDAAAVALAPGGQSGIDAGCGPPVDWDMGTEEEEWEFMVEAMDWEAV